MCWLDIIKNRNKPKCSDCNVKTSSKCDECKFSLCEKCKLISRGVCIYCQMDGNNFSKK